MQELLMRDIKIHYYYIRLLPQSPLTCQQLLWQLGSPLLVYANVC